MQEAYFIQHTMACCACCLPAFSENLGLLALRVSGENMQSLILRPSILLPFACCCHWRAGQKGQTNADKWQQQVAGNKSNVLLLLLLFGQASSHAAVGPPEAPRRSLLASWRPALASCNSALTCGHCKLAARPKRLNELTSGRRRDAPPPKRAHTEAGGKERGRHRVGRAALLLVCGASESRTAAPRAPAGPWRPVLVCS